MWEKKQITIQFQDNSVISLTYTEYELDPLYGDLNIKYEDTILKVINLLDDSIKEIFLEGISKYDEFREWAEYEGGTEVLFRKEIGGEIEELKKLCDFNNY